MLKYMESVYIVAVMIGFILIAIGVRGTFYELGSTDDKQFGKESTKRMFTSLVMSVYGLSIVVLVITLNQIFG